MFYINSRANKGLRPRTNLRKYYFAFRFAFRSADRILTRVARDGLRRCQPRLQSDRAACGRRRHAVGRPHEIHARANKMRHDRNGAGGRPADAANGWLMRMFSLLLGCGLGQYHAAHRSPITEWRGWRCARPFPISRFRLRGIYRNPPASPAPECRQAP
jgi:hypothetical protein